MKLSPLFVLTLAMANAIPAPAAERFRIYAPSHATNHLTIVSAEPTESGLTLTVEKKVKFEFPASSIVAHPDKPLIYLAPVRGFKVGEHPGAVVTLDKAGAYVKHEPMMLKHGSAYLATDRTGRFLLSANYDAGQVDVYPLNESGVPGPWASGLDEGRLYAHCILPTPDNRFIYIPFVKTSNALLQYRFDATSGKLTPLDPKDANPPAGTGPRHVAYHPKLPIAYFSNEQHLGVSVYDMAGTGQLKVRQVCDAVEAGVEKEGLSSSDIVITPDGKFLFAGIRGHKRDFDWVSRYQVQENGELKHLGLTPADKIPWGFALSPDAKFLIVSAFQGATLTAYKIGSAGELTKAGSMACDKEILDLVTR